MDASVVHFLHGPDAQPFRVEDDRVVATGGTVPFHGIAAAGMLPALIARDPSGALWERWSPALDGLDAGDDDADLRWLRATARAAGVLSLARSAQAARAALTLHPQFPRAHENVTLWNVKEGHVSSVWFARWADKASIVNVARDRAAGSELAATTALLARVAAARDDVARVFASGTVTIAGQEVVVSLNEHIGDARELHVARERGDGRPVLVAVDRFVVDPAAADPARIIGIAGRRLDRGEAARVEASIAAFAAAAGGDAIDLNHGDMVWAGSRAVIVACRVPGEVAA